ncbi:MAG: glycine cleavage system aminomethyltransferase GcvT [candidate division Zixibacteria bacterium]|nr:glycine cleavage system aminomethyltransferase GcvT [candidate division Zixibacteria bacterium]MCI0596662.1 glycine cleavage system aminomethyltransferase GcvT [candidate division Zixibacteria bacterium]
MPQIEKGVKKTPLSAVHEAAGGKMVSFAGFYMPVSYRGITEEHRKVRSTVGVFDLSHMGEFRVTGHKVLEFLQKVTTNDVAKLAVWDVQYSLMCYPEGGIVDDLLVYHLPDSHWLVVNAANIEKDFDWLASHKTEGVTLTDESDQTALIAIQGPKAEALMARLTDFDLPRLGYYKAARAKVCGEQILFSRTGYTGEDGFELYTAPERAEFFWRKIMEAGQAFDIEPIGLGARDTLRLEMKYMLYGNDIDASTNPLEAGLGWVVKLTKGDFIGRGPIEKMKKEGHGRKLVCFEMAEKAIPRKGCGVYAAGQKVGEATSGTFSPSLEKGIGLGYVPSALSETGTKLEIDIRGRKGPATVVPAPFYKNGTRK